LLVGFMYFLASWIATLPTVAIAAILIFTGITLIDVAAVRHLGVIAFGVLPGIMLGIVLSLLMVLREIARPHDALLGRVPGSKTLHDVGDDEAAQTVPGLVVYRFYGPLFFANVRFFIDRIEHFISQETQPVREVIVDARAIPDIDVTAAEQLQAFVGRLHERGIRVLVAKAHLPLREAVQHLGLTETLLEDGMITKISDAVEAFERQDAPPA